MPRVCLLPCCAAMSWHVLLWACVSVAVKKAHLGTLAHCAQHSATLVVVVVLKAGPRYCVFGMRSHPPLPCGKRKRKRKHNAPRSQLARQRHATTQRWSYG